jgi:hypothetical protein
MWRDIISVIVVNDDGRVGNVSVPWIRGLGESVFTGNTMVHGSVDYPQTRRGSGYLRSRLLACMCIAPYLHKGTAVMKAPKCLAGRDSESRLRSEY